MPHVAGQPAEAQRTHNESRFVAYKAVAGEFVDGDAYDPNEIAHMLHDLRWDEVPRAFAVALYNASRRGPIREGLRDSFRGLVEYLVFLAFGSTERHVVQPWFLQNWDFYFVAMVDGLLLMNQKNSVLRTSIGCFRRSIHAVFDMLEVGRTYMSLDSAAESTGAHALLAACASSKGCFINNGIVQFHGEVSSESASSESASNREITLAHVVFMDIVAEKILENPNRDITTWCDAFGYYVGSDSWIGFAKRCRTYMPQVSLSTNIARLQKAVDDAHHVMYSRALVAASLLSQEDPVGYMPSGSDHQGRTLKHGHTQPDAKRRRVTESAPCMDSNGVPEPVSADEYGLRTVMALLRSERRGSCEANTVQERATTPPPSLSSGVHTPELSEGSERIASNRMQSRKLHTDLSHPSSPLRDASEPPPAPKRLPLFLSLFDGPR